MKKNFKTQGKAVGFSQSGVKEIAIVFVLAGLILGGIFGYYAYKKMPLPVTDLPEPSHLKTFSSLDELDAFLNKNAQKNYYSRGFFEGGIGAIAPLSAPSVLKSDSAASTETSQPSYSTTNIQVAGVDEADIVKSAGKYVYVVSGN